MQERKVDVAVIGAGTAGLAAYRSALKYTDNVVIIEGGKFGTTCARVGCMPSKLLIAAAESAHSIEKAPEFGIEINGKVNINSKKVMNRVKSERDRFVGFVLESVDQIKKENIINGYAKFLDNNTLKIDDNLLIKAKSVVIATGSSPFIPPFLREIGDKVVLNDHVFDWDDLPKSVAVFGSGVIGLELGQALSRLGVKVKLFGRGNVVGPLSDPDIINYGKKIFSEEFYFDNNLPEPLVRKEADKVIIKYQNLSGNIVEESFDYVLAATGRKPNFSRLGLENTSIKLAENGTPVSNKFTCQCGESSIFIAGDSSNNAPLLHEASDEGEIAGKNAANYPQIVVGRRRANIGIVFSDPQIAIVGLTYKDLKGKDFAIGSVSFENQGRSRVMLKNKGLLHIYADYNTNKFLGAEMIGPSAEHLAHLLSWSYQQEMSIPQMLDMPFYHPVIEEGLRTALRDVNEKLMRRTDEEKKKNR